MPDELPTARQKAFMERNHIDHKPDTGFYDAMHLIGRHIDAKRALPPTQKQINLLKARGKYREGMSRGEAFDAIRWLV